MRGAGARRAAGLVVLGALVAGCGGDGGSAPDNASKEDFCDAYTSMLENGAMVNADPDRQVQAMKEWGESLEEVGSPEGMPEDAREGFEIIVEELAKIEDGDTLQDLDDLGGDLDADEEKAVEAFGKYVTETCPMELPDMGDFESGEGESGEESPAQ